MAFIKKSGSRQDHAASVVKPVFIGRSNELHFFEESILKPEYPAHNILSISGQGGVGKSTLLTQFITLVHSSNEALSCSIALVDERQSTAVSMMERFAEQLHIAGEFEKARSRYRKALRKLQSERESMREGLWNKVPDLAGAAAEGVPILGSFLKEGVKISTEYFLNEHQAQQLLKDLEQLEKPIDDLTKAFVHELNALVERKHRIFLFFDTFEQLASEAVPWLLNYFLAADISAKVVLIIAGRHSLEHSLVDNLKAWLPYLDHGIIALIELQNFTRDETQEYLMARGVTDPVRTASVWQISRGLPLYLSLLTSGHQKEVDPTADIVVNFLRWIPEQEYIKRELVLDAAFFSRPFNQDELEAFAYLSEQQRPNLYRWLIAQPFVYRLEDGRYRYHELAQELFRRHAYQKSPKASYTTRIVLAKYYSHLLEELEAEEGNDAYRLAEWLEISLALICQLVLLPYKANHLQSIERVLKTYELTKQTEEIIRILRELSEAPPDINSGSSTARELLEYIQVDQAGQSQELIVAATRLIEKAANEPSFSPESLATLHRARGRAYRVCRMYNLALDDFNRSLALAPQYVRAYAGRGETYHLLGDNQQALEDFDRALDLDPKYAWAFALRGVMYRSLDKYQLALIDLDHALSLNPQFTWALASRGLTFFLLGEYQRALADFDRVTEMDPQFAWAFAVRGHIYKTIKEYRQAIADFDRTLELHQSAWTYANRGEAYRLLNQNEQALEDFDRALALEPGDDWVLVSRDIASKNLSERKQSTQDTDRSPKLNRASDWVPSGGGGRDNWHRTEWGGLVGPEDDAGEEGDSDHW